MKNFSIGVDVSKEKLDLCLQIGENTAKEWTLANSTTAIKKSLKSLLKEIGCLTEEVLVCAEHTGQYTYPLCCACEQLGLFLWLDNPAQIRHCSGVKRGKDDRMDAKKIAAYAFRFQSQAKRFDRPEKNISSLKQLISERDMYIADKAKYQAQLNDQKKFMAPDDFLKKSKRLKNLIMQLQVTIEAIENDIQLLIDNDDTLSNQHNLLCSINGIGERTALKMIVVTNAFKNFDNPRQFCCHAGVAPFRYTSGTSVHSRNRVSHRADKSIKALIHMAALVAATKMKNGELREYYLRKVAEGKNKMSVINAVRAKLIHRMFAVIKHNRPYEKKFAFNLQNP